MALRAAVWIGIALYLRSTRIRASRA
jgi:hypothetical protein